MNADSILESPPSPSLPNPPGRLGSRLEYSSRVHRQWRFPGLRCCFPRFPAVNYWKRPAQGSHGERPRSRRQPNIRGPTGHPPGGRCKAEGPLARGSVLRGEALARRYSPEAIESSTDEKSGPGEFLRPFPLRPPTLMDDSRRMERIHSAPFPATWMMRLSLTHDPTEGNSPALRYAEAVQAIHRTGLRI